MFDWLNEHLVDKGVTVSDFDDLVDGIIILSVLEVGGHAMDPRAYAAGQRATHRDVRTRRGTHRARPVAVRGQHATRLASPKHFVRPTLPVHFIENHNVALGCMKQLGINTAGVTAEGATAVSSFSTWLWLRAISCDG